MDDDLWSAETTGLTEELAALRTLTAQLRSENARLLRLLELTPKQAAPPGPAQTGFFEAQTCGRWHTGFVDVAGMQGLLGQVEGRAAEDAAALTLFPLWRPDGSRSP